MNSWAWLLVSVLSALVAGFWALSGLAVMRGLPRVPDLAPLATGSTGETGAEGKPQLTVVIPARNESTAIEATLRSLLAQTIPLTILAVDDRSTDETGTIISRVASEPTPPGKFLSAMHVSENRERCLADPHRRMPQQQCVVAVDLRRQQRRRTPKECPGNNQRLPRQPVAQPPCQWSDQHVGQEERRGQRSHLRIIDVKIPFDNWLHTGQHIPIDKVKQVQRCQQK